MARPKNLAPTYKLHKPTDTARCWVNGQWVSLGKYGSPESKQAHARLCLELATAPNPSTVVVSSQSTSALTVDQVLLAFWKWAGTHYRTPDGNESTEIECMRKAIAPLRELYGQYRAAEFGPKKLAAVRQKMIQQGWCRGVINRSIDRIKRVFKWATAEELIPPTVYQGLRALAGLRAGRSEARDTAPVKPVDPALVEKTLPFLNRHTRTMVELQRLTGMRPGEVCRLAIGQIDLTDNLWVYRPSRHKTAHYGKERVIPFGPRARAVLTEFLIGQYPPPAGFENTDLMDAAARTAMANAYEHAGRLRDSELLRQSDKTVVMVVGCVVDPRAVLFSPKEARAERYRELRAKRRSKVPPSQQNRRSKSPKKKLGEVFVTTSYANSVSWAAKQAGLPHWHPNQLRHLFATEVRRTFGLEAAQVSLGHSKADVTQIYAERNLTLAARVAAEMG